jgi:dTDP-4-dehydrorhamnose 3,5-epimerase
MKFYPTEISGLIIVEPEPIHDNRGSFSRAFCKQEFTAVGLHKEFVQINHSFSKSAGILRGLHFQKPPYAEMKYIQCVNGRIFDVVVDIRKNSPTYLQHLSIELSAKNCKGILVPEGCAHGFQTLEHDTLLIYHHTEFYTPGSEGGIRFDDPALAIRWPIAINSMSERDKGFEYISHNFQPIQL